MHFLKSQKLKLSTETTLNHNKFSNQPKFKKKIIILQSQTQKQSNPSKFKKNIYPKKENSKKYTTLNIKRKNCKYGSLGRSSMRVFERPLQLSRYMSMSRGLLFLPSQKRIRCNSRELLFSLYVSMSILLYRSSSKQRKDKRPISNRRWLFHRLSNSFLLSPLCSLLGVPRSQI